MLWVSALLIHRESFINHLDIQRISPNVLDIRTL